MSDSLRDKEPEVVLSISDVGNIRDFFTHFGIVITPEFQAVINRWQDLKVAPTIGDQNDFRDAMAYAMMSSEHPMFKDPIFQVVLGTAAKAVFESTFKKEFEAQLTKAE